MIVVFENNVICPDSKVQDYLLAHHADLEEMPDEDYELCLVRLHKEENVHNAVRMDLTLWKEISRELYWAEGEMECNYSLSVLAGKLLLCRCQSCCQLVISLHGWRRCCGDMKPRILKALN